MKKIYTVPIIIITVFFSVVSSYSQDEWTFYTNTDWLVKYELPNDFHVYENTENEFRAGTDDKQFLFQLFGVRDVLDFAIRDTSYIRYNIITAAQRNNYSYQDKDIRFIKDQKGYTGFELAGRNSKNNNIIIWVLDHPSSNIELYIYFIYSDSYATKGVILSFPILWSFVPI